MFSNGLDKKFSVEITDTKAIEDKSGSVLVLLITCQSFAKNMRETTDSVTSRTFLLSSKRPSNAASPRYNLLRDKRTVAFFATADPGKINLPVLQQTTGNLITTSGNETTKSMMSSEDAPSSTTKDTIVVLITITVIFFTLIATYFLWRKHRSNSSSGHSVYMYSRLSQNDVEVDNISFQGDLTHKSLINAVPVCEEDDSCDDEQIRPATLRLEYDSLVTISNGEGNESENQKKVSKSFRRGSTARDDAPVNLLIDELSDEDLLQ